MSKPKSNVSIDIPAGLIKELLTESEMRMVKQRLMVIKLLDQGLSVREVAKKVKVGTDTVVRMSKKFKNSLVLRRAIKDSTAISPTPSSKWIFGGTGFEKEH